MNTHAFLNRLESVKPCGDGKWSARCPAHDDRSPSLSIREAGTRILLRCFAGCQTSEIVAAIGLTMADLFIDSPIRAEQRRPIPRPSRIDLDGIAFQFELAALDRRLRSESVLQAVTPFRIKNLTEIQFDRLLNAVACGYRDRDRAAFLETIADDIRFKAFQERTSPDAA